MVDKVTFRKMLEAYFAEQKIDVRVDVVSGKTKQDTHITRHDIIRKKENEDWFCFSFILHPDGGIGIWTRGHIEIREGPLAAPVEHNYDPELSRTWLDTVMHRDHILEQLTSS